MKNNNPYSKYRYSNDLNVKVRVDERNNGIVDVFGVGLRSSADSIGARLYGEQCAPYGSTAVENYVYKVQRINQVDKSITPASYKGPTFFKLFKL